MSDVAVAAPLAPSVAQAACQLPLWADEVGTASEPAAAIEIPPGMDAPQRRRQGITLTPLWLVEQMLDRLALAGNFDVVVDCGAGSGRFALAAARRFPGVRIVAVESDPGMCAVLRREVQRAGLGSRIEVAACDMRQWQRPAAARVAFIGNPPYVRHHDIAPEWKDWYSRLMSGFSVPSSQLAGLHLHFMAKVAHLAGPQDALLFVTAAEWLDNGYGSGMRGLLGGDRAALRLTGLWRAPAEEAVFPDALVSAVVVEAMAAAVGNEVEVGVIEGARLVGRAHCPIEHFRNHGRWSELLGGAPPPTAEGVTLGELFRITRGQVTGSNAAWIVDAACTEMPPELLRPALTRARELIDGTVEAPDALDRLRRVVDLPHDLSQLPAEQRPDVQRFLAVAQARGADAGYVARQRRAWHALDLRPPPPVLVSYMGRRPPVFRLNPHRVTYLNIAHGLYPVRALSPAVLARLVEHLNRSVGRDAGRVYGGGMAKFEPSDIARLRVPAELLSEAPA